jgi:hypothetical protein
VWAHLVPRQAANVVHTAVEPCRTSTTSTTDQSRLPATRPRLLLYLAAAVVLLVPLLLLLLLLARVHQFPSWWRVRSVCRAAGRLPCPAVRPRQCRINRWCQSAWHWVLDAEVGSGDNSGWSQQAGACDGTAGLRALLLSLPSRGPRGLSKRVRSA